ncbi:c-type cytochrome [Kaarinaea lacus]
MKTIVKLAVATAILSLSITAQAGDAAAGKAKSASCAGCHGMNGKSTVPTTPSLAGQQAMYLVKAMKDYKTGARKDAMMGSMVSGLSDADIEDLAAYYASVK